MKISEKQFQDAARLLACSVSAVKAVYEVETNGSGFLPDGRLKILFEGHIFWRQLLAAGHNPGSILVNNPEYFDILYSKWTKKHYVGGAGEWDRFSKAVALVNKLGISTITVMNSASYGSFQVMGFNAILSGYPDAQAMIAAFNEGGEYECLMGFARYVISVKLNDELQRKDWTGFAFKYNGPGYKGSPNYDWDDYDLKLEKADRKYSI